LLMGMGVLISLVTLHRDLSVVANNGLIVAGVVGATVFILSVNFLLESMPGRAVRRALAACMEGDAPKPPSHQKPIRMNPN